MSLTAAAIRHLATLGLSAHQIADVAELNAPAPCADDGGTAADRRRAWDREYRRRKRSDSASGGNRVDVSGGNEVETSGGNPPDIHPKSTSLAGEPARGLDNPLKVVIPGDSTAPRFAAREPERVPVVEDADDWPEAEGDPRRVVATWTAKLTALAGPGLADPAKTPSLLTSCVELGKWRRAGCSWEADVVPIVVARSQARADPITTWTFFTRAVLDQASRRRAELTIPEQPEGRLSHARDHQSSPRDAAYRERIEGVGSAMAAAVQQHAGGRRG